ncbi:MAG: fibrobacter succinogenes major paralogous domain-containing protein [Bacteroidales bacterium]|nr:fibrobacter succinogenes major paralogous domain-containing protein [Bacteroidales bacterium]
MKIKAILLIIVAFVSVTISCRKTPENPVGGNKIEIGQSAIDNIGYFDSKITTTITDLGGNTINQHGHCWGISENPTITDFKTSKGAMSQATSFYSDLTSLTPETKYYIRPYLTYAQGTVYGSQLSITTLQTQKPVVSTKDITNISIHTATGGGEVTQDGGLTVTQRGIVWSTNQDPTLTSNIGMTSDGAGIGIFTSNITNLSEGSTYYVKAYATNSIGTAYGSQATFTTLAVPVLTTATISAINSTSASGGGNISSDGGASVTARGVCWNTTGNPTISNSKTTDGTGTGVFTSNMTGLENNTIYYVRAYATNAVGTSYGNEVSFPLIMNVPGPSVTDINGNVYKTVKIGNQVWMAENLKTTKYREGTLIPNITDATDWANLTSGAYCYFSNSTSIGAIYGALYNFFAVTDNRKICPTGWHVPSDSEWSILREYLGGEEIAGGKLKETGLEHWVDPNVGADNSAGFTALGGSWRGTNGPFYYYTGRTTVFWSSTVDDSNNPVFYELTYDSSNFGRRVGTIYFLKNAGLSVRCLKD